ncbi:MAG: hypothetical protein KAR06_07935, partial [Deltaproteobacteria bacterium]|nr:hypothetical protein [Deltaproteobacteria bacterium]
MDEKEIKEIRETVLTVCEMAEGKAGFEVYASLGGGLGIEAKGGEVDSIKARSSKGVGIRVVKDHKPGFSYTNVFDEASLRNMVETALSSSVYATVDEGLIFSEAGKASTVDRIEGLVDDTLSSSREEDMIAKAIAIESEAVGFDKKIKRVRKASYSESSGFSKVVNSNGVDVEHRATYCSASVMAVAEDESGSQMGWEAMMSHLKKDIDPKWIGHEAARRAVGLLGSREIPTIKCPAVIENTVAIDLLSTLSASFFGDNVIKGKSMLSKKVGESVASECVNIVDNGV